MKIIINTINDFSLIPENESYEVILKNLSSCKKFISSLDIVDGKVKSSIFYPTED